MRNCPIYKEIYRERLPIVVTVFQWDAPS